MVGKNGKNFDKLNINGTGEEIVWGVEACWIDSLSEKFAGQTVDETVYFEKFEDAKKAYLVERRRNTDEYFYELTKVTVVDGEIFDTEILEDSILPAFEVLKKTVPHFAGVHDDDIYDAIKKGYLTFEEVDGQLYCWYYRKDFFEFCINADTLEEVDAGEVGLC